MEDWIVWIIIILLAVIIGNQTRERQERETKGMTNKQKEEYLKNIKKKQKENAKFLWWILGIIIGIIILFFLFLLS